MRAPTPDEAPALAELGRATFIETFGHLYSAENLEKFLNQTHNVDKVAGEIASPECLIRVVESDGELAGFCKLSTNPSLDYDMGDRKGMELKQLYLRGDQQGAGLANSFMTWMFEEAQARGIDTIILSVWSENHRAHRFYQRHGFTKFADTHFMVGDHRDEEFIYGINLSETGETA